MLAILYMCFLLPGISGSSATLHLRSFTHAHQINKYVQKQREGGTLKWNCQSLRLKQQGSQ